jgi:hypothetical protein
MIRRIFAFFYEQSFVYPAQCERKHRSDGNMKSLYYMSYKIAGRWTSTGADVPYGLVERLTPKRPGKWKSLLDYGWTKDSKLRVVYRVSNSILSNGIVSVPAALKSFICGKFSLIPADNSPTGTLVAKEHTAWGLGPFFRRRGGEPGDYLAIIFDLSERVAVAQIGDSSLAEHVEAQNGPSADSVV